MPLPPCCSKINGTIFFKENFIFKTALFVKKSLQNINNNNASFKVLSGKRNKNIVFYVLFCFVA